MHGGWVYIVTNQRNGTLYTGVTSDIARRAFEHREGVVDGFSKKYELKLLVFVEWHDDIRISIQREKSIKRWPRAWKLNLIEKGEPALGGSVRSTRLIG